MRLIFSSLIAVSLSVYGVLSQVGLDSIEKMSIVSCSLIAVGVLVRELKKHLDRDSEELQKLRDEKDAWHAERIKIKLMLDECQDELAKLRKEQT